MPYHWRHALTIMKQLLHSSQRRQAQSVSDASAEGTAHNVKSWQNHKVRYCSYSSIFTHDSQLQQDTQSVHILLTTTAKFSGMSVATRTPN